MNVKILVVEDHALVREGMALSLRGLGDEVTIHEACDAESAVVMLDTEKDFDLALIDLMLPGVSGFSLLTLLRKRYPTTSVIVVSGLDDAGTMHRVIDSGASGFVPKSSSTATLMEAVRQVLNGAIYMPDAEARPHSNVRLPTRSSKGALDSLGLSEAQRRVFELLTQGKSNREIGDLLGLTEGTVKVHVTHIFRALGVSSRAQALVVAARMGLSI